MCNGKYRSMDNIKNGKRKVKLLMKNEKISRGKAYRNTPKHTRGHISCDQQNINIKGKPGKVK